MNDPAPDLRILQANERTMLAWVRTGLTLMAFGFVVARLSVWLQLEHPEQRDGGLSAWLGIAAVTLGVACHVLGAIRFVTARSAIIASRPIVPGSKAPVIIASAIASVGLAAIVYLTHSAL